MADLTSIEKRWLERMLGMSGGYVLNFSNRTFAEFFDESVRRKIYGGKYSYDGSSKANHMRTFWAEESNHLVGKLILKLIEYIEAERITHEREELAECRSIAARLQADAAVVDLDALTDFGEGRDFEAVAAAVRDAIEQNEPASGLDRLHMFATKYLRSLCERAGITAERGKALHALMGEYRRHLHASGKLESKMAGKILQSSAQLLQDFNDVRNNQSLAHDNPMLNHDEALLIFSHVTSSIRFLREMEKGFERDAHARREGAAADAVKIASNDESPF